MSKNKSFEKSNVRDLFAVMAEQAGISKVEAQRQYENFRSAYVQLVVEEGKDLDLPRLFKAKHVVRAAHEARNPGTGEKVQVPEKVAIKLYALKDLK